jgi:transcriptional regulator with AAA-type ATPase domain/polyferredoxin
MTLVEGIEPKLRFLRETTVLAGLSEKLLRATAEAMRPVQYAAGDPIIHEGESGQALFVVAEGSAEVRVRTAGGHGATVATLGRSDCFGEMSLLSGEAASADVVAVEGTTCLMLDRDAFDRLVEANPQILHAFVRMVIRRLNTTTAAMAAEREKGEALTSFLQQASPAELELLGRDKAIRALDGKTAELARGTEPILIQGERGTGKELVARIIHSRSARKSGPLLSINCAGIAENRWGDPLFGPRVGGGERGGAVSYLDLARGGTLLLKNIERLPPSFGIRLLHFIATGQTPAGERPDVRILATTAQRLEELARSGTIPADLERTFSRGLLTLPPLRDRKRDIPLLARTFVTRYAARHGRKVLDLEDAGVTRLVSYDFAAGNVRELERAIERAVLIAEGETISADEIFLRLPPHDSGWRFNLLRFPRGLVDLALRAYPGPIRAASAFVFATLLAFCFFGPRDARTNLGAIAGWSIWWPAMGLSFVIAGRSWCALCPLSVPGSVAQRFVNLRLEIPRWIKRHDRHLALAGFFLIILVEEVLELRQSPRATGVLLLAIAGLAFVASLLYPRRSWCRHLCPLGGFAGVGATGAVLELRPTPDICSAQCRDHACYRGNGRTPGCPMFQHLMFVESSRDCILCLDCVRACPNGSPQLNLRAPARELRAPSGASHGTEEFTTMLGGIVLALAFLGRVERGVSWPLGQALAMTARPAFVSLLLVVGAGLPLLALRLFRRRLSGADGAITAHFDRLAAAALPAVGATFASLQLSFVPGLAKLTGALVYGSGPSTVIRFGLLGLAQLVLVLAGTLVAAYTLFHLNESAPEGAKPGLGASLLLLGTYAAAFLCLSIS